MFFVKSKLEIKIDGRVFRKVKGTRAAIWRPGHFCALFLDQSFSPPPEVPKRRN